MSQLSRIILCHYLSDTLLISHFLKCLCVCVCILLTLSSISSHFITFQCVVLCGLHKINQLASHNVRKKQNCWENISCCLVCLLATIIKLSLIQSRLARTLNGVNGTSSMLTLNARCGLTCYMLIDDCDKYLLGLARDNIMLTFSYYRRKHAYSISFNHPEE